MEIFSMGEKHMEFNTTDLLLIAIAALFFIFILIVLILWAKLNNMKKNYQKLINGTSGMNLEEMLILVQENLNYQEEQRKEVVQKLAVITEKMKSMKTQVEVMRYNAFTENGSNQSFTIAILDDYLNGLVLTGLHSREQAYVYAKPVEKGESTYPLSPEEKQVIHQIVQKM